MDEFKVIMVMNEAMMELLKDKKRNYDNNKRIAEYLKDEAFFFKISKEQAFVVLESVGVKKEKLDQVYKKLIAANVYQKLIKKGKIKADDNNLVVKYNVSTGLNDIFKNKK